MLVVIHVFPFPLVSFTFPLRRYSATSPFLGISAADTMLIATLKKRGIQIHMFRTTRDIDVMIIDIKGKLNPSSIRGKF